MREKWLEMIDAFSALTPEERKAEAEKRFDESLDRMASANGISRGEAYARLVENRDRLYRRVLQTGGDARTGTADKEGQEPLDTPGSVTPVMISGAENYTRAIEFGSPEYLPCVLAVNLDWLHEKDEAKNTRIRELQDRFRDDLMGDLDVQGTMIRGTVEDVKREVRDLVALFGGFDGGYIGGTSHSVMPETPLDNVIAMYEAFLEYQPEVAA
jgi:hypothetical protein